MTVLDVNDYRPRFTERVYNTSVFENEPSGTSVITVRATDLDEGENGAVLYSMLGPHSGRKHLCEVKNRFEFHIWFLQYKNADRIYNSTIINLGSACIRSLHPGSQYWAGALSPSATVF